MANAGVGRASSHLTDMSSASERAITAKTGARLDVIDGLRGLAIFLVVLYHLWPGWQRPALLTLVPRTGFIGVSLFFFISGFAIFYPFARSIVDGRPRMTQRTFAMRRFAKIAPSYVLSIAVVVAIGWAVSEPKTTIQQQLVTHVLFIHNFFEGTIGGVSGVLWSLAVEVQFYVLFALTRPLAMRWPLAYAAALILIALAYRLNLALAMHLHTGILGDQLPSYLDLFGAGIACAYVFRIVDARHPDVAGRARNWTALAIIALLISCFGLAVTSYVEVNPQSAHVVAALIGTLFAAAFFALALGTLFAHELWKRVVANRVALYLGLISYNLYIWHQVIYVHALGLSGGTQSKLQNLAIGLASLAVSLLVATVLTQYFERPVQIRLRHLEERASRHATLTAGPEIA